MLFSEIGIFWFWELQTSFLRRNLMTFPALLLLSWNFIPSRLIKTNRQTGRNNRYFRIFPLQGVTPVLTVLFPFLECPFWIPTQWTSLRKLKMPRLLISKENPASYRSKCPKILPYLSNVRYLTVECTSNFRLWTFISLENIPLRFITSNGQILTFSQFDAQFVDSDITTTCTSSTHTGTALFKSNPESEKKLT